MTKVACGTRTRAQGREVLSMMSDNYFMSVESVSKETLIKESNNDDSEQIRSIS